ncbi:MULTISPECIES: NADH-quinone oxidoreductase subunit L [Modicisalibacter]|uniref:NADH-quinone oxidoreductase subunit L n=1 Tax=Modicisalibacter TaxID=574347 RepID=UPI00100B0592|nr:MULTISPECIES: NADH-quinone oxidoreductase subunit L [Halomonadaceae]MBZ9558858.1 NADH-quinone oxidoreductase subunit L [Modicisalibacter sp. R2A 31.J]MBZ9575250.1 NADH-quinone oxidoreductase subunit L [Modicisalibacter sp. MOD 31.J]
MSLLPLTFLFPLAGTLIISLSRGRLSPRAGAVVGVTSVGLAALVAAWVIWQFLAGGREAVDMTLWTWVAVGDFQPTIGLRLDGLSLTMTGIITGVGFLIHLFAAWYMQGEAGVTRFYAYMNLFVFSMMLLVLGDNMLLLYLGWEGVGLCSYLLIGYYYETAANGWAAFKAFIITRLGDVFLAIGLFMMFRELGTLNIVELLARAPEVWSEGAWQAQVAALLILGGALGKSAQLPLHTWLADAMAGPTPVSALIHAATMVTAGVYLVARMHGIFELAPNVLYLVGVIGALTLLMAGFAALAQTDIKRVLAYSTMSQIGYMFLALGAGAYHAAIFHLMTHAFFKALLFLSAGSVIVSCHHEQDMRRLGGLWRRLPLAYIGFVVGGAALSALPLVTAGYYSKDEILWQELAAGDNGLLLAGLVGALLTSLYTLRLIIGTFHGEMKSDNARHAEPGRGLVHGLPLVVLSVLATFLGAWIHPPLEGVLPQGAGAGDHGMAHTVVAIVASATSVAGILIALWLFFKRWDWLAERVQSGWEARLWWFWNQAWGFDIAYDWLFVRPYRGLTRLLRRDIIDRILLLPAWLAWGLHRGLSRTQTGKLRLYAGTMAAGATLILIVLVLGG